MYTYIIGEFDYQTKWHGDSHVSRKQLNKSNIEKETEKREKSQEENIHETAKENTMVNKYVKK